MRYGLVLAGGQGRRMGLNRNKALQDIAGQSMLVRSVRALRPFVDRLIVVIHPEDQAEAVAQTDAAGLTDLTWCTGGSTRQASVRNGLSAITENAGQVLVHDAARCLVDADTIRRVVDALQDHAAVIPAIPVTDTIKRVNAEASVLETPDRSFLRAVQTPQGFDLRLLRRVHEQAASSGFEGADDASLVEHAGQPVYCVSGSTGNIKLTLPEDLAMAEQRLNSIPALPRVGMGYDVHRLVPDRRLILCGVDIPHALGLLGHSDADVATHALIDALLGAAALGDIGSHFPDSDPRYKGISSILLLQQVGRLLKQHHYAIGNADVEIAAQQPKLLPHIAAMRQNLADALGMPMERISVKATTTEHLGFEGREEGISAQAVAMLFPVVE